MAKGTMGSNANYPSNNGIALDGSTMLDGSQMGRHLVSLTIGGVPGTTASYKLQALIRDDEITAGQWVDVKNSTLSGNGAAATGQIVVSVIGEAVRLVAVNGTSPGTAGNTPTYELNAYPTRPVHYPVS